MARNPKSVENLKPIQKGELSSEEAKIRGSKGGKKSGEVRRAQRDAKSSARYILNLAAKGAIANNLKELGVEAGEITNMNALHARLYTMAMSGDINAYRELMKVSGNEPEENRKERESISSDKRKEIEMQAKLDALSARNIGDGNLGVSFNDEDGNSDVLIYLPQLDDEPEEEEVGDVTEENEN